MSTENNYSNAPVQSYAPQWAPESPFVRMLDVAPRDSESAEESRMATGTLYEFDSPFMPEMRNGAGTYQPEAEEFVQLLADVHDETFNEALFELMNEASDMRLDRFTGKYGDAAAQTAQAERFLQEHFEPLNREAEALLDNMAQGIGCYDLPSMTETEMENLLNQYEPVGTQLSPNFEFFLGKLWQKAKGWV